MLLFAVSSFLVGVIATSAAAQVTSSEIIPPSIFPVGHNWHTTLPTTPNGDPAADETYLYVPLRNDQLAAVSLLDGIIQWVIEQPVDFRPTPAGQTVFVVDDKKVRALSAATGAEQWHIDLPVRASAQVLSYSKSLIVGLVDGVISSYESTAGRPIWSQQLSAGVLPSRIHRNRLYVPQANGNISALELTTGTVLWEQQLGGVPASITADYDQLYLGNTDNFLYAIDQDDGRIRWRWRTGGDVIGAPVVDSESIYFVSLDNQLRALARKTGVQLWKQNLPARPMGGLERFGDVLMFSGRRLPLYLIYADTGESAGEFSTTLPLPSLQPSKAGAPATKKPDENVPTIEQAEGVEVAGSDTADIVESGAQLVMITELAASPIVVRAEGSSQIEFVLLTGGGELNGYTSAKPLALTPHLPLPGNEATALLVESLHQVPEWLFESSGIAPANLVRLPGQFEISKKLVALDEPPGLRFAPPLTTGLTILPGHQGPDELKLATFDPLPGVQIPVIDLTRGLELFWDSGWIVVGLVNDEVLLTPLTKTPGQPLGVPNESP